MNFSVLLSVYEKDNAEAFQTALESISTFQMVKPSEIVLVVDGPVNAQIDEVISSFGKSCDYFKVVRLDVNSGHAVARQIAIDTANYEYVAIMDSDDIARPDRFEKQVLFMTNHPDVDVLGGQINEFIGTESHVVGKRIVPESDAEIKSYLKSRCPFNQQTVFMKRSTVLTVGNYVDWFCEEDYYLWIRMMLAGCKFANLPDTLVHVRVGKDMYARRGGIRYFRSEARLQLFMWRNGIISFPRFSFNVIIRLCVQVLMPNRIRGFVFQKLFRH